MKTKLEMAHEWYMMQTRRNGCALVADAWQYADAMQAEADKREKEEAAQRRKEIREMLNAPNTFFEREGQHFDDVANQKRTPKVSRFERSDAVKEVLNRAENMGLIKPKEPRETHKNLAEFTMYPEYDASINYPPDAWVMYKGEKRLAVSINTEREWQPDWSQSPDWANWWAMDENKNTRWIYSELEQPYISDMFLRWFAVGKFDSADAPSFGYTGDWRESLRKRPE